MDLKYIKDLAPPRMAGAPTNTQEEIKMVSYHV